MEELLKLLMEKGKTISTMESCTGGGICNAITNIPDASRVFNFSAVTYSNDFKIKMGVKKELIEKYSVYSMEVASSMAKAISEYTNANYGIGVTGKLKKADDNNPFGEDDMVYLAIYDRDSSTIENDVYYFEKIHLKYDNRRDNKEQIIHTFVEKMLKILQ